MVTRTAASSLLFLDVFPENALRIFPALPWLLGLDTGRLVRGVLVSHCRAARIMDNLKIQGSDHKW